MRIKRALIISSIFLASASCYGDEAKCSSDKENSFIEDLAPLLVSNSLDLLSTEYALKAPNSLIEESNPLGGTLSRRLILKASTSLGEGFLVNLLNKHHKHNAAKWTKRLLIATHVVVASLNFKLGLEKRRAFNETH